MRHKLALLLSMLVVVLLASLGPLGPAGADDDAWAAYDEKASGTRLGHTLRRPRSEWTTANKSQAISHAAYRAASSVWPGCQANWDAQLEALGYTTADSTAAATVGRRRPTR